MPLLTATLPSPTAPWTVRRLRGSDWAGLLRINAANRPALAALDSIALANLVACGGFHLVAVGEAGEILAYLLSFPSRSPYDDEEMRHLRGIVTDSFCYVCQVGVAAGHRGRGIGHALYAAVTDFARRTSARILCCDVNVEPPNRESQDFHRRLGFCRLDTRTMAGGHVVDFLARRI